MNIFDWFKSPAQRAAEAEAALPASFKAARKRRADYEDGRVKAELGDLAARFAARTPDEAKAYRFALELIRERGPNEASRIAGRVVFYVQMLSREPG